MAEQQVSEGAGGEQTKQEKKKSNNLVGIIVGVLVAGFIAFGGWTFIKDSTFSGSEIKSSDLVQESENGVSFKRPMQWDRAEDDEAEIAYTEGGNNLDDSDQGMIIAIEALGVDYNTLSVEQKAELAALFEQQFSDPSQLETGGCEEVGQVTTAEKSQEGYDTAFTVDAVCEKFTDRNAKARIKMLLGVNDTDLHVAAVVAIEETWEKSGEALDEVLDSLMPAL